MGPVQHVFQFFAIRWNLRWIRSRTSSQPAAAPAALLLYRSVYVTVLRLIAVVVVCDLVAVNEQI